MFTYANKDTYYDDFEPTSLLLLLNAEMLSGEATNTNFIVFGAQTHNLPHSRRARYRYGSTLLGSIYLKMNT
jgi:hypothetical protein